MDNLNPKWVQSFDVQYHFEQREYYKAVIYDIDDFNNLDNFGGHDLAGELEFALHEVVTARDQTLVKPLNHKTRGAGKSGTIRIVGEEKTNIKDNEECNFTMTLEKVSSGNSGYLFYIIYKNVSGQIWKPIYKSEIKAYANGHFEWNHMSCLTMEMCNEELERDISIEFFRSQKSGRHTNLGYIQFNIAQLKVEGTTEFKLLNRYKRETN